MKRIKAFSLTELLIALSVIGVVASLTISIVSTSYKKSTYVAGLKEISKTLSDTANLIASENNGSLSGVFLNSNEMMNKFAEYIHPLKKCYVGVEIDGCWHDEGSDFTMLDGTAGTAYDPEWAGRIAIKNGMLLAFILQDNNCTDSRIKINGVDSNCGEILVDVNGYEKPNKMGRDIFSLGIHKYGMYFTGEQDTNSDNIYSCSSTEFNGGWSGAGCSGKIIKEGGMNY